MKIVKLTEEKFYFETDEFEGRIVDWAGLLTILDDLSEQIGGADVGELVSELAAYKNGASRKI
jgi:hypothetical protein